MNYWGERSPRSVAYIASGVNSEKAAARAKAIPAAAPVEEKQKDQRARQGEGNATASSPKPRNSNQLPPQARPALSGALSRSGWKSRTTEGHPQGSGCWQVWRPPARRQPRATTACEKLQQRRPTRDESSLAHRPRPFKPTMPAHPVDRHSLPTISMLAAASAGGRAPRRHRRHRRHRRPL